MACSLPALQCHNGPTACTRLLTSPPQRWDTEPRHVSVPCPKSQSKGQGWNSSQIRELENRALSKGHSSISGAKQQNTPRLQSLGDLPMVRAPSTSLTEGCWPTPLPAPLSLPRLAVCSQPGEALTAAVNVPGKRGLSWLWGKALQIPGQTALSWCLKLSLMSAAETKGGWLWETRSVPRRGVCVPGCQSVVL